MALCLLGLLAALSLGLSALPAVVAAPASVLAALTAFRSARRELKQPSCQFIWAGGSEPALMIGVDRRSVLSEVSIHLRGPIAVLRSRDEAGRLRQWVWYPDTLSSRDRRALRLAADVPASPLSQLPLIAA